MAVYTVARMIRELKKYPPDALVGYKSHDQSEDEMDGYANSIDEASESLYEVEQSYLDGRKLVVICG